MLSGKTALITGGSGAIGASSCRVMARHGADIAFTYNRREEVAKELVAEIEQTGRRAIAGAESITAAGNPLMRAIVLAGTFRPQQSGPMPPGRPELRRWAASVA